MQESVEMQTKKGELVLPNRPGSILNFYIQYKKMMGQYAHINFSRVTISLSFRRVIFTI